MRHGATLLALAIATALSTASAASEAQGSRLRLLDETTKLVVEPVESQHDVHLPWVLHDPISPGTELLLLLDDLDTEPVTDYPMPAPIPPVHTGFQDEASYEDIVLMPLFRF